MADLAQVYLTPPQVADRLRVDVGKIHRWIRSGELKATDLSANRRERPRWRIAQDDLIDFLKRRAAVPLPAVSTTRRRKTDDDVVYFK